MTVDNVKNLYEKWPYPEPIEDLAEFAKSAFIEGDPKFDFETIWPGRERFDPTILSAGCGTHQAALLALHNPRAQVVGVDISQHSLSCTQKLIDQSNLTNLKLHELSLLSLPQSWDATFDLIYCTGVLHHLEDPVLGGKKLIRLLKPGGRMVLMLYGKTLRAGIYPLQEAFRSMGLGLNDQSIRIVRGVLKTLPPSHPARTYIESTDELKYDGAIVDTFLHPSDQAFSVSEVFDFCRRIGGLFAGWVDNGYYSLRNTTNFKKYAAFDVEQLSLEKESVVCDSLTFARGVHVFVVAKPNDPYLLANDIDKWNNRVGMLRPKLRGPAQAMQPTTSCPNGLVKRKKFTYPTPLNAPDFVRLVNDVRSLHELVQEISMAASLPEAEVSQYLKTLWRSGHLTFQGES